MPSERKSLQAITTNQTRLPITGVVLCGGQATRMQGADKGLLEFKGQPMVRYAIAALADCQEILINANRNQKRYQQFTKNPVIGDSIPGFAGPLAGLLSAMQASHNDWVISCPCDCPYIDKLYVQTMWEACQQDYQSHANNDQSNHPPLIYVAKDSFRQPVFTLIHRSLAKPLETFLKQSEHKKILTFYQQVGYQLVSFADSKRFTNINHPNELLN